MNKLTYRELAEEIATFTPEQLDMDVTVHLRTVDEFFQGELAINIGTDVLDHDHPVIAVEE